MAVVQVLNVPPSADESSLREFFAFCGVATVRMPPTPSHIRARSLSHAHHSEFSSTSATWGLGSWRVCARQLAEITATTHKQRSWSLSTRKARQRRCS